jgi:hypothetical protein
VSSVDAVEVLHDILFRADPHHAVYVYRVDAKGRVLRPYLYKCDPWPGLLETLRDEFGGGDFKIMVRRGRTMVVSAQLSVVRLSQVPRLMSRGDG